MAIADYLQPTIFECSAPISELWVDYNADDETHFSRGWLMLTGLNWLLRTNQLAVIEAACFASLPSTIAKALYLFFDLPTSPTDENVTRQRAVMRDAFGQMSCRLCSHSCAGDELTKKDDLALLFAGASSWCPHENVVWRKVTAEVLMVISGRILSQTVIQYVHGECAD